jgi:hypothetical protein
MKTYKSQKSKGKIEITMKAVVAVVQMFFFVWVLCGVGCEPAATELPSGVINGSEPPSVYALYSPVRIDILPLTEFTYSGGSEDASGIKVYVSLIDSFGCQIKTPGVFRFELYQRVQRSAEPKGGRLFIWPDIDLTEPSKNNERWRDFLRAYEFDLEFEDSVSQSCILQVTCLCPNGRRLSAEFVLKDGR